MNKQTIIESIKNKKQYLKNEFGVEEIALFGSFARGEEKIDSDIDFLVTFNKPSFSKLMGLYEYLQKTLNSKVDVIRKGPHLSANFLKLINKDIIYV